MLYVIIPCILLLVVAIVLKKRESANKEKNKAGTQTNIKKTIKKNVARPARSTQRQSTIVEDDVPVVAQAQPLSTELKKSIEKLIAEKNYSSAEAKINQALNQNNAQHDLYLYLLDVHLAQKDEFAVDQLINHIQSLGLNDIVAQAEEKRKKSLSAKAIETIAFDSSVSTTPEPVEVRKNDAAFDALIGAETLAAQPVYTESQPTEISHTLDFHSPSTAEKQETAHESAQPLEFNLGTTAQPEEPVTEFSFEPTTPVEEAKTVEPLEFSFTPHAEAPVVAEPTPAVVEEPSISAPSNDLEFKFTPSETEAQPTFDFDAEHKAEIVAPVETQTTHDLSDPLVQSFPELDEVNEIQLNLDLAQHYIKLGAYASAREILTQDQVAYSNEQRQQSQSLLNQIAS